MLLHIFIKISNQVVRYPGGEGDERAWNGWMASPTQWIWVWVNSRRQWRPRRPSVLQSMGSQRVGHDWTTERVWHPGQMTSMAFPKEERVGGQFPSGEGRVGGAYAPLPAWAPPGKCPVWATTNPTPVLITACSPMVTCRPAALPKEQATGQVQSWTRYSKYRPRPSPGFTLSSVADMTNLSSSVFCWAHNWTSESFSTQCSR